MDAFRPLRLLGTAFIDLCYPPHCLVCGQALVRQKDLLCDDCWQPLRFSDMNRCRQCSNPIKRAAATCANCAAWKPSFKRLWVLAPFTEVMQRSVHLLKFSRERALAEALGQCLAQVPEFKTQMAQLDALVPVPLHPSRQRQRGYNQSEDIARGLAKILDIPLYTDVLVRRLPTRQQAKLDVEARRLNVQDSFVPGRHIPTDLRLCLVDDVVTTGTTLDACAQVLVEAGVQAPWGAALTSPFLH
jgi:ComF family protein